MIRQVPLLLLGDNPAICGGLSRIGRDIAYLVSGLEEFRVGFLGRGGLASTKLPWMQYTYPEFDGWGAEYLQDVWQNFAGREPGIVMTIWDPSRLLWLGVPTEEWLKPKPFTLWGYFPIDHEGPEGRLTITGSATLQGYDRVLAYTAFGAQVMQRSLGREVDYIPHGLNLDTFQPRDSKAVKVGLGLDKGTTLLGVVMTNQTRKDWGLAYEIISILKRRIPKLRVWCKSDSVDRHWDFRALAADFGVGSEVMLDLSTCSDEAMSYMYSACDLTFLPSLGEGFGYPIVESLACGVPCIHGNYAGGAELLPNPDWLVPPIEYRYDTRHNCKRPVYSPVLWADAICTALDQRIDTDAEACRSAVEHLNWSELHTVWAKWFREGVKC